MSKTALKKQKPPAQKLENIMFSVEAGFFKRLVKYYEDEIQKSDIELFTSSGYPDFDYSISHGLDSIGVSDFCGEFDVGG